MAASLGDTNMTVSLMNGMVVADTMLEEAEVGAVVEGYIDAGKLEDALVIVKLSKRYGVKVRPGVVIAIRQSARTATAPTSHSLKAHCHTLTPTHTPTHTSTHTSRYLSTSTHT